LTAEASFEVSPITGAPAAITPGGASSQRASAAKRKKAS
jgi:hypothetical protein